MKIPHVGKVVIEDDVELGAHTCVDRGALSDTIVRRGVKTDNFVQFGHGVDIGEDCLFVAYSGVAGSSKVGKNAILAARSTVLGHLDVAEGTQVGACGVLTKNVKQPAKLSGFPAIAHGDWLRLNGAKRKIGELFARVRALEKRVLKR